MNLLKTTLIKINFQSGIKTTPTILKRNFFYKDLFKQSKFKNKLLFIECKYNSSSTSTKQNKEKISLKDKENENVKDTTKDNDKDEASEIAKYDKKVDKRNKTLITNSLLCNLIGSKLYKINNEIKLDENTIVKLYNENDILIGERNLKEAKDMAEDLNKDVVLRQEKSNPPIVKIMKYKLELIKRLLRKLSKNKDYNLGDAKSEKSIEIPVNIEKHDLFVKIENCRELLRHFSHLKLKVYFNSVVEEVNANKVLEECAEFLSDSSKISISPTKVFGEEEIEPPKEKGTFSEEQKQLIEDQVGLAEDRIKDKTKHKTVIKNDYLFMELESMFIDTSGINYNLLLEAEYLEDIFDGLKNKSYNKTLQEEEENKTVEIDPEVEATKKYKSKLEELNNLISKEGDLARRLYLIKSLRKLKEDIEFEKYGIIIRNKILKEVAEFKKEIVVNPGVIYSKNSKK